jgi:predicted Rossmann fold nucleotide-binding protein DprA/Smf involved in DNA uptake
MHQQSLLDICANRHKGSPESIAANPSQDAKRMVYKVITDLLTIQPMTSKEIAGAMNTTINCISGRLTEMRALGKVYKTGVRREGAAELALTK